jgi:hypothetical protein
MKTYRQISEATSVERIRNHPAVESYDDGHHEKMVNLKKGYHYSGQRSFGTETHGDALKILKHVKLGKPGIDYDD